MTSRPTSGVTQRVVSPWKRPHVAQLSVAQQNASRLISRRDNGVTREMNGCSNSQWALLHMPTSRPQRREDSFAVCCCVAVSFPPGWHQVSSTSDCNPLFFCPAAAAGALPLPPLIFLLIVYTFGCLRCAAGVFYLQVNPDWTIHHEMKLHCFGVSAVPKLCLTLISFYR